MTLIASPGQSLSSKTNHNRDPCKYAPGLYLIATPIGNLGDITHRALDILTNVHGIACEDTRHSHLLLRHYGINTPTFSFHDHSAPHHKDRLIQKMQEGQAIAYITDAGTPGISDPGYELVQACLRENLFITHAPGPCAHIMALVLSGLPPHPYYFHGFLPTKSQERRRLLEGIASLQATLIFHESPRRLEETLEDMIHVLGPRQGVVGRELTKVYETLYRGPLDALKANMDEETLKGECVLLIAPAVARTYGDEELDALIDETLQHFSISDTAKKVSALTGVSKHLIYQRALKR
jgi:16S rRNA (cytidine1402-2'-O)-methyltransferase